MRILMVSDVYFPRVNGVSTSIQTFSREFRRLGHEITLIAPDYPAPYAEDDNILRIDARRVILDPEDRMMKYRQVLRHQAALARQEFDLVHVHTPFVAHYAGRKLARAFGLPLVVTYHTHFEEYLYHYIRFLPKAWLRSAARRFSRSQCNDADAIIAPSRIIVDLLQRYGVDKPIEVIPTGIQCAAFTGGDGDRFRREFGIAPERKVLLNVSRVAFEKNIELLIDMVDRVRTRIPEVCLIIAGEGPAKEAYMMRVEELGLQEHVQFIGYLDRETKLVDCYTCADYFVFASKTETQGLVLLEAMAAGTPLISIAAMGTRDILLDCPAAAVVEDDAERFSDRVIALLQDGDARARLAQAAQASAWEWDSEVLARRMLDFYERTIAATVDR